MKTIDVLGETIPVQDDDQVKNHDLLVQIAREIDENPDEIFFKGKTSEAQYGGINRQGARDLLLYLDTYSDLDGKNEEHIKKLKLMIRTGYKIDNAPDYTRTKIIGIIGDICEAKTNHDNTGFANRGKKQVIHTLQTGDFDGE